MDEIEIYYFTGTGNSLFVAREIGKRLNGKLIPIASLMELGSVSTDAEVLGIVFPVYNSMNDGLPLIVIEFVKKLEKLQSKYIFAVGTAGAGIAPSNESLTSRISLKGGVVSAFFTVKMPYNITPMQNEAKQKEIFQKLEKKLEIICTTVLERKAVPYGTPLAIKIIFAPLGMLMRSIFIKKMQKQTNSPNLKSFYELTPVMDKCFTADEKCDGCAICSRVCPVKNIEIINNKPSWQHHCETCLACFHWCPKEAIHNPYCKSRYHHPEVKLVDLIIQDR